MRKKRSGRSWCRVASRLNYKVVKNTNKTVRDLNKKNIRQENCRR